MAYSYTQLHIFIKNQPELFLSQSVCREHCASCQYWSELTDL